MTLSPAKRRTKWTDEKIKALKLPPQKDEARVLVVPGLYLHLRRRADTSLSKHWQYRAQVNGDRRWLSPGEYPATTLAKAKDELRRLESAHEAAKKGESDHPIIAARFARKASKEMPTVAELFDLWIADKRLGSPRKAGKPVRERTIELHDQARGASDMH